jgi:hypothetical protein
VRPGAGRCSDFAVENRPGELATPSLGEQAFLPVAIGRREHDFVTDIVVCTGAR